ncbi:ATP-binding cassette domain-containing protein [Agromyces endophyticus]|uniref:ABC transporter ATP-binding protein n=1 Tax=Agromyces sp. H17E-10 TaxID=2932244 RepID=UPI001FD13A17|nr:ABC transporter ATP-binding protein [Agromyces sp. H17E-10]UOQ89189.1 ATP-binding cassette domain-containing protein [Agromyces sp. H17E-10]
MTSTTPIVEVAGLQKKFGHTLAVDDVSFTLDPGGSLGIVGESGSGKTTVAKMLIGLEAPTAGTIRVCGRVRESHAGLAERRRRARELQIVFQDPYSTLDPRQTVESCIEEVLRLHRPELGKQARLARVNELADLVGFDERQRRALPRRLSGGQRQRVSIARALAVEPSVMILDESVSALDVSIQAQILNLLADIRAETSIAYILISHDLAVVRHLTETCVVMRKGQIVESGLTPTVLDNPQAAYTQLLRNSVPGPGWRPTRRVPSVAPDAQRAREAEMAVA